MIPETINHDTIPGKLSPKFTRENEYISTYHILRAKERCDRFFSRMKAKEVFLSRLTSDSVPLSGNVTGVTGLIGSS